MKPLRTVSLLLSTVALASCAIQAPCASSTNQDSSALDTLSSRIEEENMLLNSPEKPFNQKVDAIHSDFKASLNAFSEDFLEIAYTDKENPVFSPLSIATAFAMLYEGARNGSQEELVKALHLQDSYALSEQMQKMLLSDAINDEEKGTYLDVAESFFATESFREEMKQEFVDILTQNYFAEAFCGDLESLAMHQALADWINAKTRNFLDVKAEDFEDLAGILWLVNTVYLKTKWAIEPGGEFDGAFYNASGEKTEAHYFSLGDIGAYYVGEGYRVGSMPLKNGLYMNFLLPDKPEEGKTLLSSKKCYSGLFGAAPDHREAPGITPMRCQLSLTIPTFDARMKYDLTQEMPKLGVEEIFDSARADLSGIADILPGENLFVESAIHEARVEVTPSGVEAGAYTVISIAKASIDDEYGQINLNHPFLYSIMDSQGLPLFVGAVNQL